LAHIATSFFAFAVRTAGIPAGAVAVALRFRTQQIQKRRQGCRRHKRTPPTFPRIATPSTWQFAAQAEAYAT
jgi:hypothetical protein